MKITSADCVSAILRAPGFAGVRYSDVKRRSKRIIDGKVVRIFEVLGSEVRYVRVIEDVGQIVQVDAITANANQAVAAWALPAGPALRASPPDEPSDIVLDFSAIESADARVQELPDDDIDAERFKSILKAPERAQEDDIDVDRFKQIAPKPTGAPAKAISLTGKLFPWSKGQPVLLSMPGSSLFYLPCFSDEEKLRGLMAKAGITFERVKVVDDGPEFLDSLPPDVQAIVDPYFLPNGRVRFLQVVREGA